MKKALPFAILIMIVATIAYYVYKNPTVLKPAPKQATNMPETPAAQIANSTLSVTKDGMIIEAQNSDLPQLFLTQEASSQAGTKITDPTELFAIKIASLIIKTDFTAASIRIIGTNDVAVYDTKQTIALFTKTKSAEQQVDSLQQVIGKARIGDDKIAKIDLRYENPVISTK